MRGILSVSILLVATLLAVVTPALAAGDLELRVADHLTSAPASGAVTQPVRPTVVGPGIAPLSRDMTIFDPFGRLEPRGIR